MRKISALLLVFMLLLTTAGCATIKTPTTTTTGDAAAVPSTTVTTFDDVADAIEGGITTTQNADGSITVERTTVAPVLPTRPPTTATTPTWRSTTAPPPVTVITTTTGKPTTTSPPPIPTRPPTTTTTAPPTTTTKQPLPGVTTTTVTTTTRLTNPTYDYTINQVHTKLPITQRYIYSILNSEQREWYLAIDKAVTNLEARVTLPLKVLEDRNYYIYYMYMMDNPEHFYLCNSLTLFSYGDHAGFTFSYSDGVNSCRYGATHDEIYKELWEGIVAKKAVFETEVARIISTIPAGIPAVEKERLIYDYILRTSHYNLNARWDGLADDNWTAYGIMINRYGVCESYSEAFQTLCLAVGINCTGITGDAGGGHKWNAVQLDGEWYACDITFDDPVGNEPNDTYHDYFNVTTAYMEEWHHSTVGSDFPGPRCNGTKYSWRAYYQ